jgi:hypothetical protein
MKDSLSIFAWRLKAARLAKGITQEELGIQSVIYEFSAKARVNQYKMEYLPLVFIVGKMTKHL